MIYDIYTKAGEYAGQITKKVARHRPLEPWQLQHYAGRVDRFGTQREAATEAKKTWPGCLIHKTGGRES